MTNPHPEPDPSPADGAEAAPWPAAPPPPVPAPQVPLAAPGYPPPPYPAPGYPPPAYPAPGYGYAAYYYDPAAKSRLTAGLLGIFLGGFGVHRFYLGYTTIGVLQILVTIATCGIGSLWGFVEGILILSGSTITTDAEGRPLRE